MKKFFLTFLLFCLFPLQSTFAYISPEDFEYFLVRNLQKIENTENYDYGNFTIDDSVRILDAPLSELHHFALPKRLNAYHETKNTKYAIIISTNFNELPTAEKVIPINCNDELQIEWEIKYDIIKSIFRENFKTCEDLEKFFKKSHKYTISLQTQKDIRLEFLKIFIPQKLKIWYENYKFRNF